MESSGWEGMGRTGMDWEGSERKGLGRQDWMGGERTVEDWYGTAGIATKG
jgi:hypothetical protein